MCGLEDRRMEDSLLGAIHGRRLSLTCPPETGLVWRAMLQHQDGEAPTLLLKSWGLKTDGTFWSLMLPQALAQLRIGRLLLVKMLDTVRYIILGMLGHQ
jgi:hypothetical protein